MTPAIFRRHIFVAAFMTPVIVLALGASMSPPPMTLRLPQIQRPAGDTVDVAIEVMGAEKVGALQFEVIYDSSVLTAASARAGALAGGAVIEVKTDKPGRLFIALVTTNGINGTGTVATATFKVIGAPGNVTPLEPFAAQAWEGLTHREVLITPVAGQLTVTKPRLLWIWIITGIAILLVLLYMIPRKL